MRVRCRDDPLPRSRGNLRGVGVRAGGQPTRRCSPFVVCDARHLGAEGIVGAGFGVFGAVPGGGLAGFAVGWDGFGGPGRGWMTFGDAAGRTLPSRRVVVPLAGGDCHLPYYLTVVFLRDGDIGRQRRV